MLALGSLGMAGATEDTLQTLRDKHPQGENFPEARQVDADPVTFSQEDVVRGLKRFKKGSAPGLDGERAEHILLVAGNLNNK